MSKLEITELNETLQSDDQPANITTTAMKPQASTTNQTNTTQDSSSSDFLVNELIVGYPWTTGLFDCRENQRNAIITAFLPCVTFGQIAEVLDEGNSSCVCRSSFYCLLMLAFSQWVWSTEYRTKLRKKFKLEEDPYTDVATHIFCPCCALCQEFRELQNRGLDPALGWKGILAQQQGRKSDDEQLNVPPSNQFMSNVASTIASVYEMGRPEISEVDGIVQQSEPTTWQQVQQNIQSGIPQNHSTITLVVDNRVVGHPWTTGLFDCHEHQTNAIMTAFFPCVTFGQIVEVLDEGDMTCPLGSFIYLLMMPALCSQWIMGSKYRSKLRKIYNLVEAPSTDVISHFFCPCCSLCQEFRELKNRGLDPSLGWNGILAQRQGRQYDHNQQVNFPPPDQVMSR